MSPPTEQLIRDYLNRLSVAARGQLGADDRRALVNRTRDFIERKTGAAGPPTAVEVARLLSGLGDPAGIVSQERQRLAAARGEDAEPAVSRGRLARALRREPGKVRGASWHWPAQQGSRADLQLTLLDAGEPAPEHGEPADDQVSGAVRVSSVPVGKAPAGTASASAGLAGTGPLIPAQPGGPDRLPAARSGPRWPVLVARDASQGGDGQQSAVSGSSPQAVGSAEPAGPPAAEGRSAWRRAAAGVAPAALRAGRLAGRVIAWSRRRPVEAAAVALLGLGGAIYPPVWLLGAAVALTSKLWDYRDKWLGLGLPVLLTVVGAFVGVTLGGGQAPIGHDVHEGWVFAVVISRIAAALGAGYLAWRSARGKRPPAVPPWHKPRKIG
jgi:hypothetical protein